MTGSSPLSIYAVEEGIDEDVASGDTEALEESLRALSGRADKNPAHDCLMLRRVLSQDKYAPAFIQPPPMKNRTPFRPKVIYRVNVLARVLRHQPHKWLFVIPAIKRNSHGYSSVNLSIRDIRALSPS